MNAERPIPKRLGRAVGLATMMMGSLTTGQAFAQEARVTAQAEQQVALDSVRQFDVPALPLDRAIYALAAQAGIDLLVGDAQLQGRTSVGLSGRYRISAALDLLLEGSGVGYRHSQPSGSARASVRLYQLPQHTGDVLSLAPSEVWATAADDWIYETPRSVSVIGREQLDRRPARHAADMLEQTSGVYSSVSQQDPALSVNIRGIQDYGRVNMNIDGMRQNFQKSGHGQRNGQMYIDPELISSVLIDKGPSSAMGGAGALGGIATFGTLTAGEFLESGKEIGGKLKLGTGDNGTHFIGSGAFAVGNEIGDILLAASERHMGDYWPGKQGNIGDIRTAMGTPENTAKTQKHLKNSQITDSAYTMRSHLMKVGVNLPQQQRVQFSYLSTSTKSPNPSMITQVGDFTELGWKSSGFSDTGSSSLALDYSLAPEDSDWLDLQAKLYYVDTDDDSDTYRTSVSVDNSYQTQTRVSTYGAQLQNRSYLQLAAQRQLAADYGLEFFYDKASSDSSRTKMVNVTPGGNRSMVSLFSKLTYEHDEWLTLEGGLRYDRYRLRGETGMDIVTFPYTRENPCVARRMTGCPTVRAWTPWDMDAKEGHFSPTFALAVKPGVEWLQLFASYGKSWRPPALTETLTTGSAHSSSTQFPNPWLNSEHSRSWETGVNVQFDGLLTHGDRLGAKLAWFDTRVDNYINLEIDRVKPGVFAVSSGNAAYVNNLLAMRFRGLEFQLDYDAERIYGALSYTRMVGSNSSCSMPAWMGGVIVVESEPTGSGTKNYYAGDSKWNGYVRCDYDTLFGSAAYLPGDRGSLTLGSRWFDRRLDAGLVVRYNRGHQDDSTVNGSGGNGSFYVADWPEYTLVDLYASYRLSSQLKFNASVENVGNRAYIVNYGDSISYTLGRGRTVQGSLEYHF